MSWGKIIKAVFILSLLACGVVWATDFPLVCRNPNGSGQGLTTSAISEADVVAFPSGWAQGDMLYASSASAWALLNKNTSATRYLSNTGASNNPAWAQVNLANGVTGTLPLGNGGTGLTAVGTANQLFGTNSGATAFEHKGVLATLGGDMTLGTDGGGARAITVYSQTAGDSTVISSATNEFQVTTTGQNARFIAGLVAVLQGGTTVLITTNSNQAMNLRAGALFEFEDRDNSNADVLTINSANGDINNVAGDYQTGGVVRLSAAGVATFTQANVDNLRLDGNELSSTSGDVTITPTTNTDISSGDLEIGGTSVLTSGRVIQNILQANVDNLRLDGNELSSTSGAISIDSVTGTIDFNSGGSPAVLSNDGTVFLDANSSVIVTGPLVRTPVTENITAVSEMIPGTASAVHLTADASYTLTSVPTVNDGTIGQCLIIHNTDGTDVITIQDEGGLAGSNLQLSAATIAIGPGDILELYFNGTDWYQKTALVNN